MRTTPSAPRATPRTARLINDRVAYDLLLEHGPLTRSQLRELTGLAGPTVSDLVQRMEQAGLIAPVGEAGAERRGPNARLYGIVPTRAYVVGVDVQTDQVIAAVTGVVGEPVGTAEVPQDSRLTPAELVGSAIEAALVDAGLSRLAGRGGRAARPDPSSMAGEAAGLDLGVDSGVYGTSDGRIDGVAVDEAAVEGTELAGGAAGGVAAGGVAAGGVALGAAGALRAIVVGTPGLVDPATGDVSYVASLPNWRADAKLLAALGDRFGVPVRLENEVNLVGLAEHRLGAARGRDSFALLSLGEGLGVAVVLDGKLHRGLSGGAGEVGYMLVGDGTFQDLAGGAAVRELEAAHGLPTRDREAAFSEPYLDEVARRIALGAANVCAVVDPGFLVLAGPLGRWGGPDLADRVAAELAELIPLRVEVAAAAVEGNPVVRGAVRVALDLVHSETFGG